jgi:nucleoside-diphosphate-sugar epimerase
MRRGKKVIVPGDGSSLWVITHNSDFAKGLVGLLGHRQAIGHAFHITSDEVMTWDQFYKITAQAAGVEPQIVHIASDFMSACMPDELGSLTGDKAASVVFDNGTSTLCRGIAPRFRLRKGFREQSIGSMQTHGENKSMRPPMPRGTSSSTHMRVG